MPRILANVTTELKVAALDQSIFVRGSIEGVVREAVGSLPC